MSQIPSLSQVPVSSGMRVPDARLPDVGGGFIAAGIASAGDSIGKAMAGISIDAIAKESADELLTSQAEFEKRSTQVLADAGKEMSIIKRSAQIRSGLEAARDEISGSMKSKASQKKFSANVTSQIEIGMQKVNQQISDQAQSQFAAKGIVNVRQTFATGNHQMARKMLDAYIEQGMMPAGVGESLWYEINRDSEITRMDAIFRLDPKAVKGAKHDHSGDAWSKYTALAEVRDVISLRDASRTQNLDKVRATILDHIASGAFDWETIDREFYELTYNDNYAADEMVNVRKAMLGFAADAAATADMAYGHIKTLDQLQAKPYFKEISEDTLKRAIGFTAAAGKEVISDAQEELRSRIEFSILSDEPQFADPKLLWSLGESGKLTRPQALQLIRIGMSHNSDKMKMAAAVQAVNTSMDIAQKSGGTISPQPRQNVDYQKQTALWEDAIRQKHKAVRLTAIMPTEDKPNASFNALVDDLSKFVATHQYLPEGFKDELVGLMDSGSENDAYQAATLLSKWVSPYSKQNAMGVSNQIGDEATARALEFRQHGKPGAINTLRKEQAEGKQKVRDYNLGHEKSFNDTMQEMIGGMADKPLKANDEFLGMAIKYATTAYGLTPGGLDAAAKMGYEKAKARFTVRDGIAVKDSPFAFYPNPNDAFNVYEKINVAFMSHATGLTQYSRDELTVHLEEEGWSGKDVKEALRLGNMAYKTVQKTGAKFQQGSSFEGISQNDMMFFSVMQGVVGKDHNGKPFQIDASRDPEMFIEAEKWRKSRMIDFNQKAIGVATGPEGVPDWLRTKMMAYGDSNVGVRDYYNESSKLLFATGKIKIQPAETGGKWLLFVGDGYIHDANGDPVEFDLGGNSDRMNRHFIPNPQIDNPENGGDTSVWRHRMKLIQESLLGDAARLMKKAVEGSEYSDRLKDGPAF